MALLLSILIFASTAFGCACIGKVPACEKIGTVDGVFLGQVIASIQISNPLGHPYTGYLVTLAETFKGVLPNQQEVLIDPGTGSSCSQHFKLGEDYLFYASKARRKSRGEWIQRNGWTVSLSGQPTEKGDLDLYSPNYCDTLPLARASEDLEWLRQAVGSETTNRVFGRTFELFGDFKASNENFPLSNAKVLLQNERAVISQHSGLEGEYSFDNLEPGAYELWAERPPSQHSRKVPIRLHQRGCVKRMLTLPSGAVLQGIVRYPDGSRVENFTIELWRYQGDGTLPRSKSAWATSNASGEFSFVNAPTGHFVLGQNLYSGATASSPWPKQLFPGQTTVAGATVFQLAPGEIKSGIEFVLPYPLPLRSVEVQTFWADGTPAREARVIYQHSPSGYRSSFDVAISGGNSIHLKLLRDTAYEISAEWQEWGGNDLHLKSPKILLPAGDPRQRIEIWLNQSKPAILGGKP